LKLTVVAFTLAATFVAAQQPSASPKAAGPNATKPAAEQPRSNSSTASAAARPDDVDTINHIIAATYDAVSGPPGPRDWARFRSLFHPDARLIPSGTRDGKIGAKAHTPDEYAENGAKFFATHGFFEREIHNEVERFGSIAHVWSTYESRAKKDDAKPFARGINSFQLLYDGSRWWVLTIYWQNEDAEHPIPGEYLPAMTIMTPCEAFGAGKKLDGTMIELEGLVVGDHERLEIIDQSCGARIGLVLTPEQASPPAAFQIEDSAHWQNFRDWRDSFGPMYGEGSANPGPRHASLVGRFDFGELRDFEGKVIRQARMGFLGENSALLILKSVTFFEASSK
jgi:hypothetical protein